MPRFTRCDKLKIVHEQLKNYEENKNNLKTDYFDTDIEVCKSEIRFLNQLSCCKEEDKFRVGYNHNYELALRDELAEKYGLGSSDRVEKAASLYGAKRKPAKKWFFDMDDDSEYGSSLNSCTPLDAVPIQDQTIHKDNESIKKELEQNVNKAAFFEITPDSPLATACEPIVLANVKAQISDLPQTSDPHTLSLNNNEKELERFINLRTGSYRYYRVRRPTAPPAVCNQSFSPSRGKLLMTLADICPHFMTLSCLCGKGVRFRRTKANPLGSEGILRVIGRNRECKLLEVNPIWCDHNFYNDIHFQQELNDRLIQVALSTISDT